MNEQDIALLNDYFNGLLSETAADAVRRRVQEDAAFAQAFALQAEMEAFPARQAQRNAFVENLQHLEKEYFSENNTAISIENNAPPMRVKSNWQRWLAAAAVLVGIAAAFWLLRPQQTLDYAQFAQHNPMGVVDRGSSDNNAAQAQAAFNAGQYATALPLLERMAAEQPGMIIAQLNRGICLIELGRTAEARAILQPMADGSTALRYEALWYVALSHLKDNDLDACREVLRKMPTDDPRYAQAKKIME